MTISPREAMCLSLVIPPRALREVADADVDRLARQFGMAPDRVRRMLDRLGAQVRESGSILRECQPPARREPEAASCADCDGLDFRLCLDGTIRCAWPICGAILGAWLPSTVGTAQSGVQRPAHD